MLSICAWFSKNFESAILKNMALHLALRDKPCIFDPQTLPALYIRKEDFLISYNG